MLFNMVDYTLNVGYRLANHLLRPARFVLSYLQRVTSLSNHIFRTQSTEPPVSTTLIKEKSVTKISTTSFEKILENPNFRREFSHKMFHKIQHRAVLLSKANHVESEMTILDDIVSISKANLVFSGSTEKLFSEILKGAYVLLPDDGKIYNKWSELVGVRNRKSSHKSVAKQVSLKGRLLGECLFGTLVIKNKTYTWFQLEKNAVTTPINGAAHLFDFAQHRLTNKNVGPFGTSEHTEKNPLHLASC